MSLSPRQGSLAYTVFLVLAFAVFAEATVLQITARDLPVVPALLVTGIIMGGAVVGARLLFVFTRWNSYRNTPQRIWARGEGGSASFGGIATFYVIGLPAVVASPLPVGGFLDLIALSALAAFPLGRLACLLRGCCGGRPGWPTSLIEIVVVAGLLVGLISLDPLPIPGLAFLIVFAAYPLLRFLLDFRRGEAVAGRVSPSQRIALFVGVVHSTAILFLVTWSRT